MHTSTHLSAHKSVATFAHMSTHMPTNISAYMSVHMLEGRPQASRDAAQADRDEVDAVCADMQVCVQACVHACSRA